MFATHAPPLIRSVSAGEGSSIAATPKLKKQLSANPDRSPVDLSGYYSTIGVTPAERPLKLSGAISSTQVSPILSPKATPNLKLGGFPLSSSAPEFKPTPDSDKPTVDRTSTGSRGLSADASVFVSKTRRKPL